MWAQSSFSLMRQEMRVVALKVSLLNLATVPVTPSRGSGQRHSLTEPRQPATESQRMKATTRASTPTMQDMQRQRSTTSTPDLTGILNWEKEEKLKMSGAVTIHTPTTRCRTRPQGSTLMTRSLTVSLMPEMRVAWAIMRCLRTRYLSSRKTKKKAFMTGIPAENILTTKKSMNSWLSQPPRFSSSTVSFSLSYFWMTVPSSWRALWSEQQASSLTTSRSTRGMTAVMIMKFMKQGPTKQYQKVLKSVQNLNRERSKMNERQPTGLTPKISAFMSSGVRAVFMKVAISSSTVWIRTVVDFESGRMYGIITLSSLMKTAFVMLTEIEAATCRPFCSTTLYWQALQKVTTAVSRLTRFAVQQQKARSALAEAWAWASVVSALKSEQELVELTQRLSRAMMPQQIMSMARRTSSRIRLRTNLEQSVTSAFSQQIYQGLGGWVLTISSSWPLYFCSSGSRFRQQLQRSLHILLPSELVWLQFSQQRIMDFLSDQLSRWTQAFRTLGTTCSTANSASSLVFLLVSSWSYSSLECSPMLMRSSSLRMSVSMSSSFLQSRSLPSKSQTKVHSQQFQVLLTMPLSSSSSASPRSSSSKPLTTRVYLEGSMHLGFLQYSVQAEEELLRQQMRQATVRRTERQSGMLIQKMVSMVVPLMLPRVSWARNLLQESWQTKSLFPEQLMTIGMTLKTPITRQRYIRVRTNSMKKKLASPNCLNWSLSPVNTSSSKKDSDFFIRQDLRQKLFSAFSQVPALFISISWEVRRNRACSTWSLTASSQLRLARLACRLPSSTLPLFLKLAVLFGATLIVIVVYNQSQKLYQLYIFITDNKQGLNYSHAFTFSFESVSQGQSIRIMVIILIFFFNKLATILY